MPRRPATVTQADIARAIRAAKQEGAAVVEVQRDGTIKILLQAASLASEQPTQNEWDSVP
jgi:hypothetical protein